MKSPGFELGLFLQYEPRFFSLAINPELMNTVTQTRAKSNNWILILATFLVTNFFFYIDEGYFNFSWMTNWGNWVMFVVYFAFIYTGQWALTKIAWRFEPSPLSYIFGITLGTFIGTGVLILILIA